MQEILENKGETIMNFNRRQTLALMGAATATGLAAPALAANKKIKVGVIQ